MTRRVDLLNTLLCAALMIGAFMAVNPFAEMPFDDDWSYAFTVRQFLATGHITYNGWSAPLIITHALWGALWCRVFGYSIVTLRFSSLPLDVGVAVFTYLLARKGKLPPAAAVCATLMFCLSPLFLPLALSFMTDVPAIFYVVASLYFLARAAESGSTSAAISWMAAGVLAGIAGGMTRQIAWLAPLGGVPYLMVLRRSDRRFVASTALAWGFVVLDIVICSHWFAQQPNVYLDPSAVSNIIQGVTHPQMFVVNIVLTMFTAVLFALPGMVSFAMESLAGLWRKRKSGKSAVAAVIILLLSIELATRPAFGMAPWLFNIVTRQGVIGPLEVSGNRPFALPLVARGIVSALVLMTTYLLAARLIVALLDFRKSKARAQKFWGEGDARCFLVIFGVLYCGVLLIRAGQDMVFDRYCLPLIPCMTIPLMRGRSLVIPWMLTLMFGLYGLASTQDNLALGAARRAAVARLEASGVPRRQIAAGFEYDFYTQLEEAGVINRYGVANATQPFNSVQGYTPELRPKYRLEYPMLPGTRETQFGEIDYFSWLPPFHRTLYISEFLNPWWLESPLPAGANPPMNYERDYEN